MNYSNFNKTLKKLNLNKYLIGVSMIILNLFSKYVELKLTKSQEAFIRNSITREILIFTILFTATHDIIISILMTAAFYILSNTIFNEKSKLCVIPKEYLDIEKLIDTDNDKKITKQEIQSAKDILAKAKREGFNIY